MYIEFEEGQKYASSVGNDISDTPDVFQDAGYILKDDELVVDIDTLSKKSIRALITTFNIKTQYVLTDRGVHFYFKKPSGFRWAENVTMLGIPVEYKHVKNTKAVTIKRNGKLREIHNEGMREVLPQIFEYKKGFTDLVGLSEGESRNKALYSHKMKLANRRGWEEILKFINWHVFDEPLSNDEFETVARTEVIPEGGKKQEVLVAEYLVNRLDFLEYAGKFFFRPEGTTEYVQDDKQLLQIIISTAPDSRSSYQDEVLRQMQRRCRKIPNDTVFKIKFNNGYLYNGKFYELEFRDFTPYVIDIDYNPDAKPVKVVDDYINHLTKNDKCYKRLLMEVLGHTLIVDPEFKRLLARFFIYIGGGGNGKGTLLQIIKSILNAKNCTAMDIGELADERYLVTLKGKLANLGDDITDGVINDKHMKVIKNITSCDYISVRELYKQSESIQFTTSLIFTSNHILKSFEKGKSYKRRVMWLPMYTEVREDNKDPLFITKLTQPESLEYWIKLIIEGYMRLYENNDFTNCELVNEFNEDYHKQNNPYLDYLEEYKPEDFIDEPIKDIYDRCKEWCEDNEIDFSRAMFRNTIMEVFNLDTNGQRRINGKPAKVFKEISSK